MGRNIDDELQFHLEQAIEDNIRAGLTPEEARRKALIELGGIQQTKEAYRDEFRFARLFEQAGQDLRYGMRQLRRSPGFTTVAVLTLALGIGANTAIFTLINALLLRHLPVRDPQNLAQLLLIEQGRRGDSFSYPAIRALADRTDIFSGVCGYTPARFGVGMGGDTELVTGAQVTGDFYETLGLVPAAGRLLTRQDDERGADPVAVVSYRYWQGKLAGAAAAIGRTLVINGQSVTVVGVSSPAFTGANVGEIADITTPLATIALLSADKLQASQQRLRVLARPRPGLSREQLKARLDIVWPQINSAAISGSMSAERREVLRHSRIEIAAGGTGWSPLGGQFRRPLIVLMAMVGLVMLIACANVANLLLARASARGREIAVRMAIGASAQRIIRQLITESVLLSAMGALAGLVLAYFGSTFLLDLISSGRRDPIMLDLKPDLRILGFTAAVAVFTALFFGLAPAMRVGSMGTGSTLRDARGITLSRSRLEKTLVISQIAFSLLLLTGAGLFVRTLQNLERLDPGFRQEGVLLMTIDAHLERKDAALVAFYQELLAAFERLPGVKSASLSNNTPLSGGIWSGPVTLSGQTTPMTGSVHFNRISPRFFETLRTPFVAGRDFTLRDQSGSTPVAIANQAFVRRYFPGRPALGEHVSAGSAGTDLEIVGIVEDAVSFSLREPAPPALYIPYFQYPRFGYTTFEVHADGISPVAALMREEVRTRIPQLIAQAQVLTLTGQVKQSLGQERLLATLAGGFGALASLLAGVGLYGLIGYTVARRTSEFGIRMAIGAQRSDILRIVLHDVMRLLIAGVAVGIPCALAAARLVRGLLFGLYPDDPLTLAAAVVMTLATVLLAAMLPAWRAARIDPMAALRSE